MKINRIKIFAATAVALPMLAVAAFNAGATQAVSNVEAVSKQDEEVAASYKSKCAACHTPKAEKFFDPAKMDDVLVEITLKGKKAEKPPHMPGYEAKGMTKDQAKLLVAYMRQMRTPSK